MLNRLLVYLALCGTAGVGARLVGYQSLRGITTALVVLAALPWFAAIARVAWRERMLLLFGVFAALSLLWAPEPTTAATELVGLTGVLLLGALLATAYPIRQAAHIILAATASVALVSVAVAVTMPEIGTIAAIRPDGAVVAMPVGLVGWNSDLGFSACVGCVVSAGLFEAGRRLWYGSICLVMIGITTYSGSATALVAALAGVGVVAAVRSRRALLGIVLSGLAALVLGLLGAWSAFADDALDLIGRSDDLSGRTVIWQLFLQQIGQHPVGGGGLGGATDATASLGFLTHAHNGFLQLLTELGLVGGALFAIALIAAVVRAWRERQALLLGVIVLFAVWNMANNYLLYAGTAVVLFAWAAYGPFRSDNKSAAALPDQPTAAEPDRPQTVAAPAMSDATRAIPLPNAQVRAWQHKAGSR